MGRSGQIKKDHLNEGINFVGDPVVGHNEGQEGADDPEDEAAALPERGEGRVLHGKVDKIGGAIEDVGDQAEDAELQEALECDGGTEMRPGRDDPGGRDGG